MSKFMSEQERRNDGKFAAKSDVIRQVRSIRLTDNAWDRLGELADSRRITRADLIEGWVNSGFLSEDGVASYELSKAYIKEIESLKKEVTELKTQTNLEITLFEQDLRERHPNGYNLGEPHYCTAPEIRKFFDVTEGQMTGWDSRKTLPKIVTKDGREYKINKNTMKDKSRKAWYYQEISVIT